MKLGIITRRGLTLAGISVALVLSLGIWGCSNSPVAPTTTETTSGPVLSRANPLIRSVMTIQERHTPALMAKPDVIGTATTINEAGIPSIMLIVTSKEAFKAAPKSIDGTPVVPFLTDPFVAMKGKPGGNDGGGGVDHKGLQSTPILMGTSGGWRKDLANGYCCGGTLGSLIQVGGNKRILSNYHVFEADIVNGGNGTTATTGDNIVHPGLIDIGCIANNGINVATLVVTSALPGNNVDCSSANIISGQVDESGAILEIGTISSSTVGASIGQAVKKSGRTTGLSRAEVSGLNATVNITYENECAGGTSFTRTFTGQIVTTNKGSKFLAGGDSGSLMVEDASTNPRAVGLLYAGSRSAAIANPIDDVLSFLGATMVGQ
jgi:hypothetical protein